MPKRDLRTIAAGKIKRSGYPARMELFLDSLEPDDLDAVLDLLTGSPRVPHVSVAKTLNEVFADNPNLDGRAVTDDEVLRWRAKRNL